MQAGHAWLSQHYRWGLKKVFQEGHSHVIILEDDMLFSPDFLTLFEVSAHSLLLFDCIPQLSIPSQDFLLRFEASSQSQTHVNIFASYTSMLPCWAVAASCPLLCALR